MKPLLYTLTFIAGGLVFKALDNPPAMAKETETVFIEYHHVEYVYPRDDIGLEYLTVEDVEGLL